MGELHRRDTAARDGGNGDGLLGHDDASGRLSGGLADGYLTIDKKYIY